MSRSWRFVLIIVLQTLLLAAMVGMRQYTLTSGTRVLLETRPIDPRSLFRGDYIRLNYSIASLPLEQLEGEDDFKRHDTVFVLLRQGETYWEPHAVYHQPPALASGEVMLRGEVLFFQTRGWNPQTNQSEARPVIGVRYGIENYFLPEGEGRRLERPAPDETISVEVAVDSAGRAAISALKLNGKRLYREGLL